MNKAIQWNKGYPDLLILKPRNNYAGCFLEIKKDGETLYRKTKGSQFLYRTPHLEEQANILKQLREMGYYAEFAIGFDDCKSKIDNYLKG